MKCAAKQPVQLRLCRQKKCPTHLRLRAYLIKCLETTRRPWIRINFHRIAETFGVCDRTLRRAKKRLEQDNDLKFRTLSKASGSGWVVIVALEANLLWDKEPLFYKRQQDQFRSRNVKDRHCGDLIEERMASSNLATRDRGVPVYTYETIPQKRWPSLQHVPISGIRHGIRHVPIQGTWGRTSENKGFSQQYAYCLTANSSTIELLKNAANRLQPTTNGLKGRWSTVKLPGNGNGEKVAKSSAFVDSLRKCNERRENYEYSALLQVSKFPRPQPSEQSHRGFESLSNRHLLQWKLAAFSDQTQAQCGGGGLFGSACMHQTGPEPHLTERGTQSQAQCGNLLHRRPYPDPRLTDEVGTQTPAAVTQLHFVPRQGESESLRQPNRIELLPSKQRVVFTSPAVSRAAASNSPRSNTANCKSAGYAQNVRIAHVIGHLKEADSKSASSSHSAQARQAHNLKITSPSAQTTSLTRSQAPVVADKQLSQELPRTSVNRKPAKRLVVGVHRPANPPSAQITNLTRSPAPENCREHPSTGSQPVFANEYDDRRIRVPQVNDLNPQHPESQSGAPPLVIGDDQHLTDSDLYRERSPVGTTAVKTRSQRSRRWILAASGAELRRLATTKQIRLAYFHARSACTWSIWDNCKVKEQPTVAKSLWLAGLLAGYSPKAIDRAFDEALHYGHGMATDVGLNEGNPRMKFEMSIVVSYAKKLLQNQNPE